MCCFHLYQIYFPRGVVRYTKRYFTFFCFFVRVQLQTLRGFQRQGNMRLRAVAAALGAVTALPWACSFHAALGVGAPAVGVALAHRGRSARGLAAVAPVRGVALSGSSEEEGKAALARMRARRGGCGGAQRRAVCASNAAHCCRARCVCVCVCVCVRVLVRARACVCCPAPTC